MTDLDSYQRTFLDEQTVEEKLAALDRIAEPPRLEFSALEVVVAAVGLVFALGWLCVWWRWM